VRLRYAASCIVEKGVTNVRPHVDLADVDSAATGRWEPRDQPPRDTEPLAAETGDVLVNKLRPYLRKIAYVDRDVTCSTEFLVLRPRAAVLSRYLFYIACDRHLAEFAMATVDGVRMPRTSWAALGGHRVRVPTVDEQTLIADFLDRECERIATLMHAVDRTQERLAEWLDGRIRRMLYDPDAGVPFGRFATLHRGFDLPDSQRRPGNVPVIGSGGPTGWHDRPAIRGPAVVTGRYGSIGQVEWMDDDCWPLNTTLYVRSFSGSEPRFVYWLLRAVPLKSEGEKAAVPGLHRADAHRLRVKDVPRSAQAAIVRELDACEHRVKVLDDQLAVMVELLTEYRDALIAEAVTGQLDVSRMSDARMDERAQAAREGATA